MKTVPELARGCPPHPDLTTKSNFSLETQLVSGGVCQLASAPAGCFSSA